MCCRYQPGLPEHSPAVLPLLDADLAEVARLLPPAVTTVMREATVYINISYRHPGHGHNSLGACCHMSAHWLAEVARL